ncbi:BofC C-terminal domain-containing protein [Bacillus andreraoultii]|uniref:BofC C-terminal domain-containing protein n=1 Tax=Bacillus andreraoultii TaxID=1499685 RepID=UPI00067F33D0|nr:BofC C-terminal domain-containing protein [Bacillus andreraoultii]
MGISQQIVTAAAERQRVVILERHYLDGDRSEEVVIEELTYSEIRKKYTDWSFVFANQDYIKFTKFVNDISPLLKSNGFFGITKDGTLSIFNGKPNEENVIHSFFQIDLGKLETRSQEQLVKGIPVRTKEDFIQVLEAFKPYSLTIGQ